jgi:serine phosphatase RsbU (regulator of sigma subunit)
MPSALATTAVAVHTMQCMEVWGGQGECDSGVTMPGIDAWVVSRPYEGHDAGGDIHYLSSCGTGRISRMLVADVAGHGRKVAKLAASLRGVMRRYVNYVDQGKLVERLNVEFAQISQEGRFATAIVATYFAPSRTLVVCNAAHPRPLAYSSRRKRWIALEPTALGAGSEASQGANLPLGIEESERYEQFRVNLRTGDLVVVYSDALTEARDPAGHFLGEEGLLKIVAEMDPASPADLARSLYQRVVAFTGGAGPGDDVTIMVLRPNGLATQAPFLKRLGAGLRFFGVLGTRLFRKATPVPWPEPSYENVVGSVLPGASRRVGRGVPEL